MFPLTLINNELSIKLSIPEAINEEIIFTLDTGSEISLVKANSLKPSTDCKQARVSIIGIHPSMRTQSIGSTTLNIDPAVNHSFYIMAEGINIATDGIIGLDLLRKFGGHIDLAAMCLTFGGPSPTPASNPTDLARIHATACNEAATAEPWFSEPTGQTIPPLSKAMLKIEMPLDEDVICLRGEPISGLLVGDTLLNKQSPFVAALNTTLEPIRIDPQGVTLRFMKAEQFQILSTSTTQSDDRSTHIKENIRFSPNNSEEEKNLIQNICEEFADIFYIPGDKLSHTNLVEHRIPVKEGTTPIYTRQYRIPERQQAELDRQIHDLEKQGIIEPSFSAWNSPLLLVDKKKDQHGNKQYRLVVDFRRINEVTTDQSFPIPIIEEILDLLGGSSHFTTLDLHNAYYQVLLNEDDRKYTAFQSNKGKYQFTKMAMGLKASSMTWQQAINIALSKILGVGAYAYLDDIIIFGKNLEEHSNNLREVFEALRRYNFKLKIEKSLFLQKEVNYLGYTINREGSSPDKEKTRAIADYPQPRNLTEVQRFLGCCNYYRRYIANYAHTARPLHDLCKKQVEFVWSTNCQRAFESMKEKLVSAELLLFPDFNETFILTCDASDTAIGAVLSQGPIPQDRPIQFFSRTLTDAQTRYPTIEKELLSIVAAVEHFRHYLYGRKFVIYTDHKPLLYVMNNRKPNSRLFRWKLALLEYDFVIVHKAGAQNVVADALSRITIEELITLNDEDKKVLAITRASAQQQLNAGPPAPHTRAYIPEKSSMLLSSKDVDHIIFIFNKKNSELQMKLELKLKHKISGLQSYVLAKINDIFSATILPAIARSSEQQQKARDILTSIRLQCQSNLYERIAINLEFSDHISYNNFKAIAEEIFSEENVDVTFYLNKAITLTDIEQISEVLKAYHLSLLGGHTGMTRMFNRIRQFYWWPTMRKDIEKFVSECSVCKQTKVSRHTRMPIEIVSTASRPFQTVFIDTVGPIYPASEDGNLHMFTCECDLTKFAIAKAIPDTTSETVAKAFVDALILRFKIPEKVLMDNGSCFTAELFKAITKLLNIKHKHIAPYNPKTNLVERLHRSLNQYLRAFTADDKQNWDRYLPYALNSYNNTPHSTTGVSPHELVYGFTNEIPTKIIRNQSPVYNYENYSEELRIRLSHAHRLAKQKCDEAKRKHESQWNKAARPITINIGDKVFVRNKTKHHKFDTEYTGPYIVTERISPTSIKAIKGRKTITTHIDLTIKSPSSPVTEDDEDTVSDSASSRPDV